jgi:hypothetical protein
MHPTYVIICLNSIKQPTWIDEILMLFTYTMFREKRVSFAHSFLRVAFYVSFVWVEGYLKKVV